MAKHPTECEQNTLTLPDIMARQLEAYTARREELRAELDKVEAELRAIEAYKAAKEGRPPQEPAPRKKAATTSTTPRAQRGSRQQTIINLLKENPGLERSEILTKLNAQQGSAEASSISNTLTTMKGKGHLTLEGGKYNIATPPE